MKPLTIFIALWFPLLIFCLLLLATYECVKMIAATYGINMSDVLPWIETSIEVPPPALLLGAAIFAYARGRKIRMKREKFAAMDNTPEGEYDEASYVPSLTLSFLERISIPSAIFAFLAVPFWLGLPVPLAWSFAVSALIVLYMVRYGEKGRGLYY